MHFQKGQKVVFVHEQGGGTILEVQNPHQFLVEDDDGFERVCRKSEITAVYSNDYKIDESQIQNINEDETFAMGKKVQRSGRMTGSRKLVDVWEIDLHIEALTDSHSALSNTEIVQKQLQEFRTFYTSARAHHIRKLVVIHGVGTGVLKEEVREFLTGQEGVEFFDADYREYGKGATTVEIRYNITPIRNR